MPVRHPRAVNTSTVADPRWTGGAREWAVVVSRGEPRRTNDQMAAAVGEQISRYLRQYGPVTDRRIISQTISLVLADYVWPNGSQGVSLTREHLFKYLDKAREA